jgi:hypothetical protein
MKNKFLKEYIVCYLFEEIETVTSNYISLLNKYEVCKINDLDPSGEKVYRLFEDRLLSFLNNILEDEPLKGIEQIIEEWEKTKHNPYCNHHIAFEELIAHYTILKETLTLMLEEYTSDLNKKNHTINELEILDQRIQEYITDEYRNMQMSFKKNT